MTESKHLLAKNNTDNLVEIRGLWSSGNKQEAVNKCQAEIAANPDNLEAQRFYALMLNAVGRIEDAFQILKNICERFDSPPQPFHDLMRILISANNLEPAQKLMLLAVQRHPSHAPSYRELAYTELRLRQPLKAIEALEKCIELEKQDWRMWHYWGLALADVEKPEDAVEKFRRALELASSVAEADSPFYRQASFEEYRGLRVAMSDALNQAGRTEESKANIREILNITPNYGQGWYALSNLMKFDAESPELLEMEQLLAIAKNDDMPPLQQQYLLFALGKAWRDAKDPAKAMGHYDEANRRRRAEFTYDNDAACAQLKNIAEFYPDECFKNLPALSSTSDKPNVIFVIGMPRCGSTLTEQILSSHPKVHGAGELMLGPKLKRDLFGELFPLSTQSKPDQHTIGLIDRFGEQYLAQLEGHISQHGILDNLGGTQIIIDKMLGNFMWVGLILQAIPNARFVHCTRNPIDTCLSCYSLRFSSGHPYSFDQAELGEYYRAYEDLMAHWHKVIPSERLMEVSYEDIVHNTEQQARRLLKFAGIDWTDSVLEFHKNRRSVRTASFDQVTKPIYSSSIERWKPYEPYIGPLLKALGINPT